MNIEISITKKELGEMAAQKGARLIRESIRLNGEAFIIVATGASQFEMLEALVKKDIEWSKVTCFHLDEYIGMPLTHPASFRKYLKERFVDKINLKAFNYINGEGNPRKECERLGRIIGQLSIDVAFIGIGKMGIWHLTTLLPILKPKYPILSLIWTKRVENSRWAKDGSMLWKRCLIKP